MGFLAIISFKSLFNYLLVIVSFKLIMANPAL